MLGNEYYKQHTSVA